jgi:hypothetical protein
MFISALIIYRDLKLVLSAIPSPEFSPSALAVDTTNPGLMKRKCRQLRAAFLATVFEDYTPGAGPGGSFGAFGGSFFGCSLLGGSGFGAPDVPGFLHRTTWRNSWLYDRRFGFWFRAHAVVLGIHINTYRRDVRTVLRSFSSRAISRPLLSSRMKR